MLSSIGTGQPEGRCERNQHVRRYRFDICSCLWTLGYSQGPYSCRWGLTHQDVETYIRIWALYISVRNVLGILKQTKLLMETQKKLRTICTRHLAALHLLKPSINPWMYYCMLTNFFQYRCGFLYIRFMSIFPLFWNCGTRFTPRYVVENISYSIHVSIELLYLVFVLRIRKNALVNGKYSTQCWPKVNFYLITPASVCELKLNMDSGASVDKRCYYSYTVLAWAIVLGHPDVVRVLMAAGESENMEIICTQTTNQQLEFCRILWNIFNATEPYLDWVCSKE